MERTKISVVIPVFNEVNTIGEVIRRVLDRHRVRPADSLEGVLEADREARRDAAASYAAM